MVGLQFVNITEEDFGGGIDARSAENQIEKGYAEDLLNLETVEKRLRKRAGNQGKAGNIPVRVASVTQTTAGTDNLCFSLDGSIDLSSFRSSPIVVYGLDSISGSTEFGTTARGRYYPAFTTTIRKTLSTGSGSFSIRGDEHDLGTYNVFFGLVESTSAVTLSNTTLLGVDSETIDESTTNIGVSYTNGTGSTRQAIAYYLDKNAVAGSVYVATTAASSIAIASGTHGLSNTNIVVQCWGDLGTTREKVRPNSVTISSVGTVTVTFSTAAAAVLPVPYTNYSIILSAVDDSQILTGSVANGVTGDLTLTSPTGGLVFSSIYRQNGTTRELVEPDTIIYDADASTLVWTLTNGSGAIQTYQVYYEYGQVTANQLCVTSHTVVGSSFADPAPQLTIWGLDHGEIYSDYTDRQGWANNLDSYRVSGGSQLVCGLGGNLFGNSDYTTSGTSYLYGYANPNLRHTVAGGRILGPLFWDNGETPGRYRGYVTATTAGTHWGRVTSVSYNTGTGYSDYTISLPGKSIFDSNGFPTTLSNVISTTTGLQDWLTVEGMGYSRQNGTFRIRAVVDGTDEIVISVENTGMTNADWDDTDTGGLAGVFTDQADFTTSVGFIPGDQVISSVFGDNPVTVLSCVTTTAVLGTITGSLALGTGLTIPARRTSSVVPVRNSADYFLRGDILSYSAYSRLFRVLYVNTEADASISIAGDGTTAIVTTGSTSHLRTGQSVVLVRSGVYTGVQEITELLSSTQFTFSSTETDSVSGTLQGECIQVDEEVEWEDTTTSTTVWYVPERWIPIEAPTSTGNLLPPTHRRYWDSNSYSDQPFLRSTMVNDTLYLTNGSDEVQKYDGANVYRAGLLPWQPGLFVTQDTAATAKIGAVADPVTPTAASGNKFTAPLGTQYALPVGTRIAHAFTGGTNYYTVTSAYSNATNDFIEVNSTASLVLGAAPTLTRVFRYYYYFRLSMVDANNNIIASAVTGSTDYVVELASSAAVYLRLVGLPAWDNYDYDRIDVQVYRTKAGTAAPFYLVASKPLLFDSSDGYIDITDSSQDEELVDLDTTSVLSGSGLGNGWQEPLRASYVTSAGNSLVLANVRDYPQLDIQIETLPSQTSATFTGTYLEFRRNSTTAGTVTNCLDTFLFEWKATSGANTVSALAFGSDQFTATVTALPGSVVAGDWVYLFYSTASTANRRLDYCGWYQIASVAATNITFNQSGAAAIGGASPGTNYPDRALFASDPTDVVVPLGTDGNQGNLNANSILSAAFLAMRRMAMAINSVTRKVDTTITGMSTYTPWLTARSGGDFSAGQLIVRQPRSDSQPPRVRTIFTTYNLFVNNSRVLTGDVTVAETRTYPSRLLFSYENYPEIFDRPTAIQDTQSQSAIDVNPADGQQITGVIPFFGDAAFGAAQQSAVVVVFKSNSIYLVDLNEKRNERNPVQRIETEGLGCTAPYSIAVTKNGIIFANESGIYALGRNLSIRYLGKFMERRWLGDVNRSLLSIAQGHHYAIGRQYKLSVPIGTNTKNSEVYVYDHTAESVIGSYSSAPRDGAWSRFDSHPATGWTNLERDAYFCTSSGRVMSVRRDGSATDYRDGDQAITCTYTSRALDFGNGGIRKCLDGFAAHYRTTISAENTSASTSLDLRDDFHTLDPFVLLSGDDDPNGIGDLTGRKVRTVWHSVGRRKGVYFQVQISNSGKDEPLELAGLDFKVAGLSDRGILMAAETASTGNT